VCRFTSRSLYRPNPFNCRETEPDWDKDLADDVKGECQEKYGKVEAIKVEKETQVLLFYLYPENYVDF
jgi:RNA-binding protein 39